MSGPRADELREEVRRKYAEEAGSDGRCGPSCCSQEGSEADDAAEAIGYTSEELAALPEGSNMGLGCGNPTAIAALKQGETVLDLGSDAGIDCFISSGRIGPAGRVIGVDMTPEMISGSRRGAGKGGFENVEFRLGEIEHIPAADSSVDVVISNCVINLSPDKEQVYREIFRVLKSGGRLAVSDIVAIREMTERIRNDMRAYSGCMAGAVRVEEMKRMLTEAGFASVSIEHDERSIGTIKSWFADVRADEFVRCAYIEAGK